MTTIARYASCALIVLATARLYAGEAADGGRKEPLPSGVEDVALVEKLDAQLPLNLPFKNESGAAVKLGDYFGQKKPVLMVLVYFECPMLCTPLLNGMIDAMKEVSLTPGKDYECVVVSFDPLEQPALAAKKKTSFLEEYGRPAAGPGLHFLTGEKANIKALADALGFGFKWIADEKQYAHPASLYVITPEGRISRYLKGIQFDARTMRLSLVDAADGKIGSLSDQAATFFCYQYDPAKGQYSVSAIKLMRAGGIATLVFLALGWVVIRNVRQRRLRAAGAHS